MTKIERICRIVCDEFGVTYNELTGTTRRVPIPDARHTAMVVSIGKVDQEEILTHFNRERTTMIHARGKVDALSSVYPAYRNKLATITSKVRELDRVLNGQA